MASAERRFYVYRIFEGLHTLYVGKGSGRRLQQQKARFRAEGEIIEVCKSDDHAFTREVYWIAQLHPTENKCPGGNGGRCRPARKPRLPREYAEMERVGLRRYAARFLATRLSEANCQQFGVSKVDLNRLIEVANGPRC